MKTVAARLPLGLTLLAGLTLAGAAFAGAPHDAHETHAAPPIAKGEAKTEDRAEGIAKAKAKPVRPLHADKATSVETAEASKGGPQVSMADLRELLDQKIAEVRARQEAAPVVRVANPAPRKRPVMVASAARTASETGAQLPKAADVHGHGVPGRPGAHGHDVHWAYSGDTGPEQWGRLKPEYQQCMLGKRQSPIDIRDGIRVQLEDIKFDYRDTPFTVVDNGHTVQVNVEPGNSITVGGRRYELLQFHFHRPSEERINGRQFEMVAHLVHKDPEGRLAVIAVLMDQGREHPMVQLVWNSLPLERNSSQPSPVMIDMNLMLPEQRQYYTYMGSLTTPPCTEGVLWMVMKQPATLTREQIGIFARLYPMNARPVQAGAGRLIKDGQ